ncbi:hypothetical protein BDY21DRAFT_341484 [Lineolata rhizophorae]|uniref:FAD/NAD(P)-binding domain-containing protein n=1 Tax=Lineolata rhizophorae TaxID=578093 RepID=A0A6A6P250_9PEZI|nr:hypothetical protein BDY21DRAFT_341484 [Lineolata rhizophorae]
MMSVVGDTSVTTAALDAMNAKLKAAKTVVVGGGGPSGVETAGEIGEMLNGAAGWFADRPAHPKAAVTLVTASDRLLPLLRPAIASQAEAMLRRVGVDVRYNTKIESVADDADGATTVHLSSATAGAAPPEPIKADAYVPAVGLAPNSGFVPAHLLDERRRVKVNAKTLRVDGAGPRVYCVGDVGDHTPHGGIPDTYSGVPVLGANMKRDCVAAAAGKEGAAVEGQDKEFTPLTKEAQIVPVGRSKGVGAIMGFKLPSILIWLIKGRTFMLEPAFFVNMTYLGNLYKKEAK